MLIPFYGPWRIEVVGKTASYLQRYVITGSNASDGPHIADLNTPPLVVDGAAWTLALEWNDNVGSGWLPSDVRRNVTNTLQEGLVTTLGADDNYAWARDNDYDDVVLGVTNQDPALNPWVPFGGHPDFTVGGKTRDPKDPQPGNPLGARTSLDLQPLDDKPAVDPPGSGG